MDMEDVIATGYDKLRVGPPKSCWILQAIGKHVQYPVNTGKLFTECNFRRIIPAFFTL
jgi:hypothetical protein